MFNYFEAALSQFSPSDSLCSRHCLFSLGPIRRVYGEDSKTWLLATLKSWYSASSVVGLRHAGNGRFSNGAVCSIALFALSAALRRRRRLVDPFRRLFDVVLNRPEDDSVDRAGGVTGDEICWPVRFWGC